MEIAETKLGDHPTTADALNDLGRLLEMRGDLEQAESLHRRAIALSERLVGPMHVSVAVGLTGLGITQVTKGEYRTALGPFERAVQIFEQIPGIQINEPVARFGVAMALDGSGGDRERSIATAMKSLEQQRTLANDPRLLARIEAWLSERGRLPIAP